MQFYKIYNVKFILDNQSILLICGFPLSKEIPNWSGLLKLLRETFNLPTEKVKPGPRDIQALGLVYSGEYRNNPELEEIIKASKPKLDELRETFNTFIKQNTPNPRLLIP